MQHLLCVHPYSKHQVLHLNPESAYEDIKGNGVFSQREKIADGEMADNFAQFAHGGCLVVGMRYSDIEVLLKERGEKYSPAHDHVFRFRTMSLDTGRKAAYFYDHYSMEGKICVLFFEEGKLIKWEFSKASFDQQDILFKELKQWETRAE